MPARKVSNSYYDGSAARKICQKRVERPIETTFELVDIIKSAMPSKALNKFKSWLVTYKLYQVK